MNASLQSFQLLQVLGKITNFTVNRDHSYKIKETGVVTYTCRYSSGHLIHNLS